MVQQGFNIALKVGDKFVAGQLNVGLKRSQSPIDITNKINGEWKESLTGLKTWSISCSGVYVKDKECFSLLEQAFMNNEPITAIIERENQTLTGRCLITDFPLTADFHNQYRYSIQLLGDGELEEV